MKTKYQQLTYEEALEEVISFFQKELRDTVNETTSINYDLQLAGIEMDLVLFAFEECFEISIENADWDRYYWAEEVSPFFKNENQAYYTPEKGLPLTISHLALVVQAGYWFDVPLMYCYPFIELSKQNKNR